MMEMSKSYRHALLNADVLDTFKVPCTVCRVSGDKSNDYSIAMSGPWSQALALVLKTLPDC